MLELQLSQQIQETDRLKFLRKIEAQLRFNRDNNYCSSKTAQGAARELCTSLFSYYRFYFYINHHKMHINWTDQTVISRIVLYVQSVNAFEFEFRCKCTRHTHTPGKNGIQVVNERKANTLKKRKYAVEMKTANMYTTSYYTVVASSRHSFGIEGCSRHIGQVTKLRTSLFPTGPITRRGCKALRTASAWSHWCKQCAWK